MADANPQPALQHPPRRKAGLLGLLRARRRLLLALVGGTLLFVCMPSRLTGEIRVALAWDGAVLLFLLQALALMRGARPEEMRRRAAEEDASMAANLLLSLAAAALSLGTVGALLLVAQGLPAEERVRHLLLCGVTIFLSWLAVHTFFAVHYAHDYYDDTGNVPGGPIRGGLRFPAEDRPDYFDFLYYAFVVGMTAQVADVGITARSMRRATLVHGIVSFAFNTVILAFAVNIAAGLI